MKVRRIVTGRNSDGKSVIVSDGASPAEMVLEHTPGFISSMLWRMDGTPDLTGSDKDPMIEGGSMVTGPGGSAFWLITFPPDSVLASVDWSVGGAEMAAASPGIAERMEPDNPGMHQTPSIDYATLVSGTLVLELDDGEEVELQPGDTVVQRGTRHAWRNRTDQPATLSVVLLGAKT